MPGLGFPTNGGEGHEYALYRPCGVTISSSEMVISPSLPLFRPPQRLRFKGPMAPLDDRLQQMRSKEFFERHGSPQYF